MRGKKTAELDAVAAVQEQTAQAAALAQISGQELLSDPRLNPATRSHADRLRVDELVKALDASHSRALRRDRVRDARASEAERTLEAIALADRASSPARSVLALHNGKRAYMRLSVAASLALSAGSAMGVEAAAHRLDAPTGSGYLAEIGLTGLATAAITYRAHLAEHRGELDKGSWQSRALWALMTVPLLISVGCNLATLNAVGAFCAISAVAFSLLSCVIADRSSAAMQDRAAEVDEADAATLRAVAMGEDLPPVQVEEGPAIPESGVREIEESRDSGDGAGHIVEPPVEVEGGHIDSDQHDPDGSEGPRADVAGDDDGESEVENEGQEDGVPLGAASRSPEMVRVLAAAEARRAAGEQTRARVADFLTRHPDATIPQIATGLQLSDATAKRHRRALRGANGVEL